uniref:Replication initiation protein-like C-terminal domain-containing protein n=1 Tax=uncultured prokaryote TaxID=198431 RepID=A0A0H5Q7Z4_9ZZZZ|nr:hypothetical protein [uncultured prokaryote]
MHDSDAICRSVEDLFLNAFDMELSLPTGRRFNGYKDSSVIRWAGHDETTNGKAHAGFVAWGGNANKFGNETLCVHLTGQGCESINMLNSLSDCDLWEVTADVISQHDAKITRLDLAYDDLEGEFGGVGAAVGWYKSGAFCSGGRMPSVKQVGDWITGESRTFYIGKAENGKMMRIYEKGHQMGDLESPWVRYEVQIGSKDREIPVTALMFRDAYMAGTYPAMKFILKVAPVSIPTVVKKRLKVTLDKLTVCASVSYGKLINALTGVGMSASEVVETLRRDGLPSRMFVPPSAC